MHVLGTPPALILSQDQTLKLKSLSLPRPCGRSRKQLVNPSQPVELALSDSCYVKCRWFASAHPGPAYALPELALRHPLILDGLCACTFYLVFKEPSFLAPPLRVGLRLGEPSNFTIRRCSCQPGRFRFRQQRRSAHLNFPTLVERHPRGWWARRLRGRRSCPGLTSVAYRDGHVNRESARFRSESVARGEGLESAHVAMPAPLFVLSVVRVGELTAP